MDAERKYRQHGYRDSDSQPVGNKPNHNQAAGLPKHKISDGPRLPRLVQSVTASRCFNCATTLVAGTNFASECPKCHSELHCCKQCTHFEPSTRFQCLKPIAERVVLKDKANDCQLFNPKVTVARDVNGGQAAMVPKSSLGLSAGVGASMSRSTFDLDRGPKSPNDARAAFDSLFKK
jgi:hypothetical protein